MIFSYLSWPWLLLAAYITFVASVYVRRYIKAQMIKKLGGRAPAIKNRFPLGLDYPVRAARAGLSENTYGHFLKCFNETGTDLSGNGSYTCELHVLIDGIVYFTADPENIKAVLTTQFQDYGKGEKFHESWENFLGDSIFTTDGKQWQDSRALIRPMFVREKVADFDLFELHDQKLIKLLGNGDGAMVDFKPLIFRYTLDVATHFLFGESFESLEDENSEFLTAFDEVQYQQSIIERLGPLKWFYPRGKFWKGLRTMERYIQPVIKATLDLSPKELEAKASRSDTFIHALARFTRDPKVMRDQLTALLLAGRDSTAATLCWVFLELSRNPQVFSKLKAEIRQQLGDHGEPPTYEDIKNMKYLTAVINETLRIYPVVPFNVRSALHDTTLPRGGGPDGTQPIGILKGTFIGYCPIIMQRRPDLYPPLSKSFPYDPLVWAPDRWLTWTPKPWTYIPFNGGPRICIGQQFATVEIGYTIIRILQNFESLVDYNNNLRMHMDIVLTPADGVKIGFVKNENATTKSNP